MKSEDNLRVDSSFNGLQIMLFIVSSLAQVAKYEMTVASRFGVHVCITFWVELNSLHVASDFFRGGCCIHPTLYLKMSPL